MKKILNSLVCLILAPVAFAQYGIVWEPEIEVAEGATYGTLRPRLALTANDVPVVVISHPNGTIHSVRKNGNTFGTPVPLLPGTMESYVANWTGPDIAASGDQVVVVFKAQTLEDGHIYAVRSTDGGLTFSDTLRVDSHEAGRTMMPALDMDANGNPIVTYMVFDASETDSRIAIARSADGGLSYLPQQVLTNLTPGVACDCCPPEMVVSNDYQLALFRNNDLNIRDTWGVLSENAGVTYDSQDNLNDLNWEVDFCPSTGAHGVIIGDSAYVVSASQASSVYRVYISSAHLAGGLMLENMEMVAPPALTSGDTQNFPRISGSGDTLVMVWEEKQQNNPDIQCAVTIDGSIYTLAANKSRVNENSAGSQGKPDVIYRNGYVHVIYQDNLSGSVIYRRGTISAIAHLPELSQEVRLYPNPVSDVLTVEGLETSQLTTIRIHSTDGKPVPVTLQSMASNVVIRFPNTTPAGIYLLTWRDKNGTTYTHRIALN